jgi:hypothetical protein
MPSLTRDYVEKHKILKEGMNYKRKQHVSFWLAFFGTIASSLADANGWLSGNTWGIALVTALLLFFIFESIIQHQRFNGWMTRNKEYIESIGYEAR